MSTHDLCFKAKIRKKNVYPCKPQLYYKKVGSKGVFITRTCNHDEHANILISRYFIFFNFDCEF